MVYCTMYMNLNSIQIKHKIHPYIHTYVHKVVIIICILYVCIPPIYGAKKQSYIAENVIKF